MTSLILETAPLSRPWICIDPFIFCAYHLDFYPQGNGSLGLNAETLGGRPLGSDFSNQDGFSMYHGDSVPGFPNHPHRGFETVTIVRKGYVDHADSLGARARYGVGDVQWLTAGSGVQHSEMFPLPHTDGDNHLELFQIWLNLPKRSKFVPPAFKMLWAEQIPHYHYGEAKVTVVAGTYQPVEGGASLTPPSPAPDSWGSDPRSDLALWLISLPPGAELSLPKGNLNGVLRTLYIFEGSQIQVGNDTIGGQTIASVDPSVNLPLRNNGPELVQILMMQGVPLDEPIAAAGPFVMNTQEELYQARSDFMRTQFGGWPWPTRGPTHGASLQRFAHYPQQPAPELPPTPES